MPHRVRMIAGPEMYKLAEHLFETGQPLPNPILSVAWIAEDENEKIIGHIILHSVPIIEYLKIDADRQGNGLAFELMDRAREFVESAGCSHVLMHSAHPVMRRILARPPYNCRPLTEPYMEWNRR